MHCEGQEHQAAWRFSEVLQQSLHETEDKLAQFSRFRQDYTTLKGRVASLPAKLSHEVMVPFDSVAFMPGRLVHTNELLVLLGDNYFVEKSAAETCEFIDRRLKSLGKSIKDCEEQRRLLTERQIHSQKELRPSTSVEMNTPGEIREEYVEEDERVWMEEHRKRMREERRKERERIIALRSASDETEAVGNNTPVSGCMSGAEESESTSAVGVGKGVHDENSGLLRKLDGLGSERNKPDSAEDAEHGISSSICTETTRLSNTDGLDPHDGISRPDVTQELKGNAIVIESEISEAEGGQRLNSSSAADKVSAVTAEKRFSEANLLNRLDRLANLESERGKPGAELFLSIRDGMAELVRYRSDSDDAISGSESTSESSEANDCAHDSFKKVVDKCIHFSHSSSHATIVTESAVDTKAEEASGPSKSPRISSPRDVTLLPGLQPRRKSVTFTNEPPIVHEPPATPAKVVVPLVEPTEAVKETVRERTTPAQWDQPHLQSSRDKVENVGVSDKPVSKFKLRRMADRT